ncbi:prolyl oligopeptidase family serine peptidase [uncultured Winogradskyella sp.]|uniref:carboxylesterase family protein n=1 Tax=uncultured Winogradskyella sp. TaxID=395353 RepID=UPI0030EC2343|tara:strand:+ start:3018 stop:3869 length:852 start_codon:yes stop_codon:yes gene_type:complete
MKIVVILLFLCFGCNNGSNETLLTPEKIDELLVKNTFKASNNLELPYRLFSPYNQSVEKKPLIVFLHGRGDRGSDNSPKTYHEFGFVTNLNSLVSKQLQSKYPSYIVVPQCSAKTENEEWAKWVGNSPETPFDGLGEDGSYILNDEPSASGQAALRLIENLIENKNIDKDRIYIIGLSMGGFGVWEFTARKPNLFAAAVPMAGYSDPFQIENIKHIPFWIFHGSTDKWNPVEGSRTMYNLLLEQDADVTYTEYKNTGHGDAFKKAFNEPELLSWLFSKSKNSN